MQRNCNIIIITRNVKSQSTIWLWEWDGKRGNERTNQRVNVLGIIFPLGCDTWRFQMAKAIQITQIDMREMHIRSHLICPISPSSRSSAFAFDVIWNAPCSRPFASSFIRLLYSFFIYLCLTLTWCTALEVWLYWLKWNFKMNSHKKNVSVSRTKFFFQ